MSYNPNIVTAYYRTMRIPKPVFEHRFHPVRKWRFDLCWPEHKVALEVQGSIFKNGRHNRGAAMLKEWEKLNTAAAMGWRILYCQPSELCMVTTCMMIVEALNYESTH